MLKIWNGEQLVTTMMEIDYGPDWSALIKGNKRQLRSIDRILPFRQKAPSLVMCFYRTEFKPHILTGIRQQTLIDMDEVDARAEGYASVDAFKDFWMHKIGEVYYSPMQRVWVYDLEPFEPRESEAKEDVAMMRVIDKMYPRDLC